MTFVRAAVPEVIEIRDPDLVEQCHDLRASADVRSRWRLSRALSRYLGWEHSIRYGAAHTCWKAGDAVFLSTVPGVISCPQQAFELRLTPSSLVWTSSTAP